MRTSDKIPGARVIAGFCFLGSDTRAEVLTIFDIDKSELPRLSAEELEELVARLAEAEIAAYGHSPAWVSWSGSTSAPDGGIDIRVQVPVEKLNTGFLERPDTIFQAKKHSMPKAAIKSEMISEGALSPAIIEQAARSGSYIIVSLDDDCSPTMKSGRLHAMREAIASDSDTRNIHLDFYDRSKLTQWVRQHPSVLLWLKEKLGQGYSGWQPYGAWSNPPKGFDDKLISAPGVTVTIPSGGGMRLNIDEAIEPLRKLIRSTTKAVRITGLSGVGKTRIVQALFDERVGTDALDRTVVVYVDTGANPNPSCTAMLDRLIAEGRRAAMVLDNCPSELHSSLASKVSATGGAVSLITIEYDIREDKPQTTEVVHIEAVGPDVAELLIARRFPGLGRSNARRIAVFADGNARVALAIAERVEEGESLALLSDAELFDRLFEQRKSSDDDLREQAEILSLVYSVSVSSSEDGQNELDVLGSIMGHPASRLFKSVQKLLARHIAQKRGGWRAILPHAVANRLAASALDSISIDLLRATFEASGRQRLLMSFSHRLGLLHDHPVAKSIVEAWLQPDGLLGRISTLSGSSARMLDYIAPVAPEALLDRIEAEVTAPDFEGLGSRYDFSKPKIENLLQSLAYESSAFCRCIRLLILLADYDKKNRGYDAMQQKIIKFFQPYLSGTHATLEQRVSIMNECFSSGVAARRSLAVEMLSAALGGPPWGGAGVNESGARPRDFGSRPSNQELVEWRSAFIDVAVRLGTCGDDDLERPIRLVMANRFGGMWHQEQVRDRLVSAVRKLNAHYSWSEGWKAVRSKLYFSYVRRSAQDDFEQPPEALVALEKELKPSGLISEIMAYVLCARFDHSVLDSDDDHETRREALDRLEARVLRLGEAFAGSDHKFEELCPDLFSGNGMHHLFLFGRGLAKGAGNLQVCWEKLVDQLERHAEPNIDFSVFCGFIAETDNIDCSLVTEMLDRCAQHSKLKQVLVGLHARKKFTETDLDRCMSVLDSPDIHPDMYGAILWRHDYESLPQDRIVALAQKLLSKTGGDNIVLNALGMKISCAKEKVEVLSPELRYVGLAAAIQRLQRDDSDYGGMTSHHMERVLRAAFSVAGNESKKLEWIDTIFAVVDERHGHLGGFEEAIETTAAFATHEFLNRAFQGTAEQQRLHLYFLHEVDEHRLPLAKVDINALIEWCRARADASVWVSVAPGINLWSKDESSGATTMSTSAVTLLEASPEPEAVLDAIAECAKPSSWSGSRARLMQARADAVYRLIAHESCGISKAAKSVFANLSEHIKREEEYEQQINKAREQRFE